MADLSKICTFINNDVQEQAALTTASAIFIDKRNTKSLNCRRVDAVYELTIDLDQNMAKSSTPMTCLFKHIFPIPAISLHRNVIF